MKTSKVLFCLCLLSFAACSGKKVIKEESVSVTPSDVISLKVNWVKDKGHKFDLEMIVSNVSKNDIIIMLGDITCSKGTKVGILQHTFFNTGERTIDFRQGQSKKFHMVCDLSEKADGDHKISVSRIYNNPAADGATKGEQIGKSVEWTDHV